MFLSIPHPFLLEGKLSEYADECIDSVQRFRERGNHAGELLFFGESVRILYQSNDFDRCINVCREWLARIPPLSDQYYGGAYFPTYYCSKSWKAKDHFVQAEEYARRAIDISRGIEDKRFLVQSVCHYSLLLAQLRRFDDAVAEIEAIRIEVSSSQLYGELFSTLARIHRKKGNFKLALEFADQAITKLSNEKELPKTRALAYMLKADIIIDLYGGGNVGEARNALDAADSLIEATDPRRQALERIRARILAVSELTP